MYIKILFLYNFSFAESKYYIPAQRIGFICLVLCEQSMLLHHDSPYSSNDYSDTEWTSCLRKKMSMPLTNQPQILLTTNVT